MLVTEAPRTRHLLSQGLRGPPHPAAPAWPTQLLKERVAQACWDEGNSPAQDAGRTVGEAAERKVGGKRAGDVTVHINGCSVSPVSGSESCSDAL